MLYIKENPTGADRPIQRLQSHLYDGLRRTWGIKEGDYNSFGRVYRNQTSKGYIPEAYMGSGEYRDTFIDDRFPVTSFFAVESPVNVDEVTMRANVSLIFCVDLNRIKQGVKHRADEEAHLDVVELCNMYGFAVKSIVTGIDKVFQEYSVARITFNDMHPHHCFRVNLSLMYKNC